MMAGPGAPGSLWVQPLVHSPATAARQSMTRIPLSVDMLRPSDYGPQHPPAPMPPRPLQAPLLLGHPPDVEEPRARRHPPCLVLAVAPLDHRYLQESLLGHSCLLLLGHRRNVEQPWTCGHRLHLAARLLDDRDLHDPNPPVVNDLTSEDCRRRRRRARDAACR